MDNKYFFMVVMVVMDCYIYIYIYIYIGMYLNKSDPNLHSANDGVLSYT